MKNNFKCCDKCGSIYNFNGEKICPKCLAEMDEQFEKIKKYLQQNPNAGVAEIAEETEVDEKVILHFLREGRLELAKTDAFLKCVNCSAPIASGRYCQKCSLSLSNTLNSAISKAASKQTPNETKRKEGKGLHIDVTRR